MQTIDDFLKKDMVSFLDALDRNSEKNVASVDETNELLKENFNNVSNNNSNTISGSQNMISPATTIKTVNVYQTVSPQNINPSIPNLSSTNVSSSGVGSDSSSSPVSNNSASLKSSSVVSSSPVSTNSDSSSSSSGVGSSVSKSSASLKSSSSGVGSSVSKSSASLKSSSVVSSSPVSTNSDSSSSSSGVGSSVSKSSASSSNNISSAKKIDLSKENEFDIYVKAIIALHKRDFDVSINYLSFLLSKHSNNVVFKSRLQDALLLKAKLDNKHSRHKYNKGIKHKNSSSNLSSLNNYLKKSKEINLSSIQFDKYVTALHELKKNNKDVALELLSELSKKNPNNFSIKLHLKEAQEL